MDRFHMRLWSTLLLAAVALIVNVLVMFAANASVEKPLRSVDVRPCSGSCGVVIVTDEAIAPRVVTPSPATRNEHRILVNSI